MCVFSSFLKKFLSIRIERRRAIIFVFIHINQSSIQYMTATGEWQKQLSITNSEIFYWGLVLFLLINSTLIFLSLTVIETKRWQGVLFVDKVKNMIGTKKRLIFFHVLLACMIFALSFYLVVEGQLLGIQVIMMIFLNLGNCVFLLWTIRKRQRTSCPHCKHSFSGRDLRKVGKSGHCLYCDEKIYYHTKASVETIQWAFFVPILTHFPTFFLLDMAIYVTTFSFILIVTFINLYILNYTMVYSKKDKPLW